MKVKMTSIWIKRRLVLHTTFASLQLRTAVHLLRTMPRKRRFPLPRKFNGITKSDKPPRKDWWQIPNWWVCGTSFLYYIKYNFEVSAESISNNSVGCHFFPIIHHQEWSNSVNWKVSHGSFSSSNFHYGHTYIPTSTESSPAIWLYRGTLPHGMWQHDCGIG